MRVCILAIIFLSLLNCSSDDSEPIICTDVFVYGLKITVRDSQSNSIVTEGISVSAKDGDYEEQLTNEAQSHYFFGAGERKGTYTIEISGSAYKTFISEPVQVTADNCHVQTEIREYSISPL